MVSENGIIKPGNGNSHAVPWEKNHGKSSIDVLPHIVFDEWRVITSHNGRTDRSMVQTQSKKMGYKWTQTIGHDAMPHFGPEVHGV